mmetsp:Transcript_17001/g.33221  ORF Transcript_17001/g.33221 Transcript_17001/m.33221 type:complete len:408 (-) Transcript_17001:606-1829(-)|eukprot:CAMPEP_0171492516 /NCGR_PEP_ID=MMETSP0958-20121227/4451_1 /TAXON_ID=87120 /ORGANISM="Aurantiochytrium limacinum, Strain ATCCMYA-1381" /LENGTH=407 /DNA_ID=CAMNT_0012026039 /DNA_START=92 /DNA_END=1315 /DNA_ORIENTATION=+
MSKKGNRAERRKPRSTGGSYTHTPNAEPKSSKANSTNSVEAGATSTTSLPSSATSKPSGEESQQKQSRQNQIQTQLEQLRQRQQQIQQQKQMQKELLKKTWMPDEATEVCLACQTPFNVFTRRHHCRRCLRIFCSTCSPFRAHLAAYPNESVRICISCFKALADEGDEGAVRQIRDWAAMALSSSTNSSAGSSSASLRQALEHSSELRFNPEPTDEQQLQQSVNLHGRARRSSAEGIQSFMSNATLGTSLASLWARSSKAAAALGVSSSGQSKGAAQQYAGPTSPKLSFTEVTDDTTLVDHRESSLEHTILSSDEPVKPSILPIPPLATLPARPLQADPVPLALSSTSVSRVSTEISAAIPHQQSKPNAPFGWYKWLSRAAIVLAIMMLLRRYVASRRALPTSPSAS